MIAFTRTKPNMNADGSFSAPTVTTITGDAIQVKGEPEKYQALGLVVSVAPTLLFTPTQYGLHANGAEFVMPGDSVFWANDTFTVRDVDPIAPDAIVIVARIIVSK